MMKTLRIQINDKLGQIGRMANYSIDHPQTPENKFLLNDYKNKILSITGDIARLLSQLEEYDNREYTTYKWKHNEKY